MRGAECVHDEEVAQRGVLARRGFDVLLLASVEAAVFQQHDFAGGDLETAIRTALQIGAPGDVLLLSPACASFDQFRNFEDRGDRFKALVKAVR